MINTDRLNKVVAFMAYVCIAALCLKQAWKIHQELDNEEDKHEKKQDEPCET